METILFSLGIFGVMILIMSVGVLFKRNPLKGTCGGIASLMGSCDVCDKKNECSEAKKIQCQQEKQAACSTIN